MKKTILQRSLASITAGVLAGSAGLCLAGDITYNFDSGVQGWYAADGHGSVTWDETHGRGGGGCLKYTMVAGTDSEVDPRVDVAFDTTGYFSVEFDMMVDVASGTDGTGGYGNLQVVARDASWSWDSMWFGAVGTAFNTYQHVKKSFTSAYGAKAYLQFQLQSSAPPYSGDVTIYIDNVVIRDGTPPNVATFLDFAWPEETTVGVTSWVGGTPAATSIAVSQDTSAAPLHPDGSLKMVVNYNASNGGWQEGDVQLAPFDWDPSKFTWLEFDLYMDAPTGLATYGIFQVFEIKSDWGWQWIGGPGLSTANIGTWTHYKLPISSMALSHGIIFQPGGGMTVPVTYYVDNVVVWRPAGPPTLGKLAKGTGIGGVQITMDQNNSQWQRDAICTPSSPGNCFWVAEATPENPVTYSFTINDFPDAVAHGGFEAHLFLVNEDTIPSGAAGNETYGACDWNAADCLRLHLTANAGGGYDFSLDWKTNLPAANPLDGAPYHPASVHSTTALGTWSMTFTNNTDGFISGPENVGAAFTLPVETAANFNPLVSFMQFGMFKNDGANDGHNNGAHGSFARIQKTGGSYTFDDNFPGPGLTANYAWRTTSASAIEWMPPGIGWWLSWTTPDDGYSLQVAPTANGPYTDAGVTYTYLSGANRVAAVPSASLPAGNAAFFRLMKP